VTRDSEAGSWRKVTFTLDSLALKGFFYELFYKNIEDEMGKKA